MTLTVSWAARWSSYPGAGTCCGTTTLRLLWCILTGTRPSSAVYADNIENAANELESGVLGVPVEGRRFTDPAPVPETGLVDAGPAFPD